MAAMDPVAGQARVRKSRWQASKWPLRWPVSVKWVRSPPLGLRT